MALAYGACDDPRDAFPRRITYLVGADGRVEHGWTTRSPGAQAREILGTVEKS